MLIFQARTKISSGQSKYTIAQTPAQKAAHFDILSNSVNNYLFDPIRLNKQEHPTTLQTEDPDKYSKIRGPQTRMVVKGGSKQVCNTYVMCAANPVSGAESHEADFLEKIFSIREVMGQFKAEKKGINLKGANRVLYGLSTSFFEMSIYYSVPPEFRQPAIDLARDRIKQYLSSNSATLSIGEIFKNVLKPLLSSDLGLEPKSISAIEKNYLKLIKYLESIIILITNDGVPTRNMFLGPVGMQVDEKRIRALNVGPKNSGDPPLSESLNEFATQSVPVDANLHNIVYLYYDLMHYDLQNQQNIERTLNELSMHMAFFTNIFINENFDALPAEFSSQAKQYVKLAYEAGTKRGLSDEQIKDSFRKVVSDIKDIQSALKAGDVERAWELLNLFKSKYAISRFYEFEWKKTEFTSLKTPEQYAQEVSGSEDFLPSEDVAAYIAASLSLNLVARLMIIKPKPKAKLLAIRYYSKKSDSKTTIKRLPKNNGVQVTSSSKWTIFVDKQNSIFNPVDEIMIQTGLSALTNVNKGKNNGVVRYAGKREDETGVYYDFSISETKKYSNQQDLDAHQTKFYAPYTLSEADPGEVLYEIVGGTKYYEKVPPQKPPKHDFIFGSNFSSEHFLGGDVKKTTAGTISVNESASQGYRDVSVAAQGYGGMLLGLKNDVEANLIRSFIYGESSTGIVAAYWSKPGGGFESLRKKMGLAPDDPITVEQYEKFCEDNEYLVVANAIGPELRADILNWIADELEKKQTKFDPKWLKELKQKIESGSMDLLTPEGLKNILGNYELERLVWRAKSKGYEALIWSTSDKAQRKKYLDALTETLAGEYRSNWLNMFPNVQAEHFAMGRLFSSLEAMQTYVEQNSAFSVKYVLNDAIVKGDTFYAKLSLTVPIGQGVLSSGGELPGTTFNFAYQDPYTVALRLGWQMPIYKNEYSKMDMEIEMAGFVAFPRNLRNTEYNENLMGSKTDWASNPGIVAKLMGWLSSGADKSQIEDVRRRVQSARAIFEYKHDSNGVKICNDLLGNPSSSDPVLRVGVLNSYLNGTKDERIVYNTIGALRDFCVENYSGLPTSNSSIFLGTFFPGSDFASYFGSEKIKGTAGAGYAKITFNNVVETSKQSDLKVRTNFYPTFAINMLKDAALSSNAVGGVPMFRGPESDEKITLQDINKKADLNLPYFFTITSEADWSYELPALANMTIKLGGGGIVNWTAIRITDVDAHVDLNYQVDKNAIINLRLQGGASKFLYQSDFIPNFRASLQTAYSDVFGLPFDAMLNVQYGIDSPNYPSGYPVTSHLESFGVNFGLQTSFNRIVNAFSDDAEVKRLHPSINFEPAQNPTNVRSWRVGQARSAQTGVQSNKGLNKDDKVVLNALELLTPGERSELEQYRINSLAIVVPEFELSVCPPELREKYENALMVSKKIIDIREKSPEIKGTLTEKWISDQLMAAMAGSDGGLLR